MVWFGLMVESHSRKRAPSIVSGSQVHEGEGILGQFPSQPRFRRAVGRWACCPAFYPCRVLGLGVGRTERPACPSGNLLCHLAPPYCPVLALMLGCDCHTWTQLVWELQAQLGRPPHSGVPGDRQAGRVGGLLPSPQLLGLVCQPSPGQR